MTRPIERADVVDYLTYEDERAERRAAAMAIKAPRRVHLGECMTLLFENRETLLYQVQEIVRAERLVRESAICAEIDVYNGLLGGPGELSCVLLIEIPDRAERDRCLRAWAGLERSVYVVLPSGRRVYAAHDGGQVDDGKLSAVQYLRFALDADAAASAADAQTAADAVPVALGTDFAPLACEVALNEDQRGALGADLAASREA